MITKLRREPHNNYSLNELVSLFDVSISSYRRHQNPPITQAQIRKTEIVAEMKRIHHDKELRVYGSPRMTEELNALGYSVCENTVAKWMQEHSLVAKGFKAFSPPKTPTPDPNAFYSPNLIENSEPTQFAEILISDITYIRTNEGWMYLAGVIDLYSRAVLGWQLEPHMEASIVVRALKEAIRNWSFDPGESFFHSDHGSQYSSDVLRAFLADKGITQSMSAKGNCYDNAACESFFSSFKRELMPDSGSFDNQFEARSSIFKHIEGFYNTRRRHSAIGMQSPTQFLNQTENALAA